MSKAQTNCPQCGAKVYPTDERCMDCGCELRKAGKRLAQAAQIAAGKEGAPFGAFPARDAALTCPRCAQASVLVEQRPALAARVVVIILGFLSCGLGWLALLWIKDATRYTCSACGAQWAEEEWEREGLVQAFRKALAGRHLENRLEWTEEVSPFLFHIDERYGVEALVAVLLSPANQVVDVIVNLGTAVSVSYSGQHIFDAARKANARKIILGHNHPRQSVAALELLGARQRRGWATPSDADVESAARMYLAAKQQGYELVDDLVVCESAGSRELKSTLRATRFREMIRGY